MLNRDPQLKYIRADLIGDDDDRSEKNREQRRSDREQAAPMKGFFDYRS